jgi:hypothetical protein
MTVLTEGDELIIRMQKELGVLASQTYLLEIQKARVDLENASLYKRIADDAELIEALKQRILKADEDNKELKKQQRELRAQWDLFDNGTDTV